MKFSKKGENGMIKKVLKLVSPTELELDEKVHAFAESLRVMIFKSDRRGVYHARVLRGEMFRIQPTFPQKRDIPKDKPCDEWLWIEDPWIHSFDKEIKASSVKQALDKMIQMITIKLSPRQKGSTHDER